MLPYIDGMYSVYYTAGRIARKISRPAAGRIDTAFNIIGLPESFFDNIFSTATFPTGS